MSIGQEKEVGQIIGKFVLLLTSTAAIERKEMKGVRFSSWRSAMRDAYEVLQEKQAEMARIRKEIDSLNIVARLLSEDGSFDTPVKKPNESSASSLSDTISRLSDSAATNVDSMFSSIETRPGFLGSVKRAK